MFRKWIRKLRFNPQQILALVMLAVIIYMAVATLNVISRNYQLQQRMDKLASENEILELENEQLRYEITYYQTDAFVEKEAREKLELQAPGERVVIFPDKIPEPKKPPEPEPEPTFTESLGDNFREWVYFLFRIEV